MTHAKPDAAFDVDQTQTLTSALDAIIPRSDDGRMPGAGELGLASVVGELAEAHPELHALVVEGIAHLDGCARARHAPAFRTLGRETQVAVLEECARKLPGFVAELTRHTYGAYYQDPRVVRAIGLDPRPPFPRGHPMPPVDLSLLDPVRRRGHMYRACDGAE